jgi:site-specific DNA recombinase
MTIHHPGADTRILRAALYVRVSSVGQEQDGTSLETQEERCRAHAEKHGYAIGEAHVYREVFTGTELWERPKLTALREAIRRHEIDLVIVYAIDRLARDPVHLGVILSEAEHVGVEVEFVTEPLDSTPEGQLIRYVRGYAAKVEHEKIKERTWRGRLARVQAGKPVQCAFAAYGYRWDPDGSALRPDPERAPIVKRIFREAAEGRTVREIALRLTADGIPTPKRASPTWAANTIRLILHNPVYLGQYHALRWQELKIPGRYRTMVERPAEEQILLPVEVTPLVDAGAWHLAQERLRRNKAQASRNNRAPEATLLRGGFLRCGSCGRTMSAHYHSRQAYWLYRCGQESATTRPCPAPARIAALALDSAVWALLERFLTNPAIVAEELERLQDETPPAADLKGVDRALLDVARKQANLVDQLADLGGTVAVLVRTRLGDLEEQRQRLLVEREGLLAQCAAWERRKDQLGNVQAWCQTVAQRLECLDYATRRSVIELLGVEVVAYPKGATPRWTVTANVPLQPEAIVKTAAT